MMHVFPRSNQLSYIAQLIRQLKKVSICLCLQQAAFKCSQASCCLSLREHQSPLIFSRYFKNVRATIKMNGEFSEFSHRLCHKATSLLYVLSSGNIRKGFFACLLIINHDISAAAEQNKKVGWGCGGMKMKLEISSQSGKTSLRCVVTFFKKMGVGHA